MIRVIGRLGQTPVDVTNGARGLQVFGSVERRSSDCLFHISSVRGS